MRNLIGEKLVEVVERLIRTHSRHRPVYGGAKTFSETVLTDKGTSFKQVVMVEFPRTGVWSIGFITSENLDEIQARTGRTC